MVDTIYGVGNSVDTSYDPSGDYWSFAPDFLVQVVTPVDVQEQPLPLSHRLLQNFPNPFNPSTTISYQLEASDHVTLEVFDLVGQRVATLVDEVQTAGDHSVNWHATENASGIYLCRLSAGKFVATKKLVFLR
jgi:hypothetical protein